MSKFNYSDIKWIYIFVASVIVVILTFSLVFGIVTIYGFKMASTGINESDILKFQEFAEKQAPLYGTVFLALLTFIAAIIIAYKVEKSPLTNALALGIFIVLLINALDFTFNVVTLVSFASTVAASFLGGLTGLWVSKT